MIWIDDPRKLVSWIAVVPSSNASHNGIPTQRLVGILIKRNLALALTTCIRTN